MAKIITPLAPNVPIVDKDGNPTPYFQRVLQELTDNLISEIVLDGIGGDPGDNRLLVWDDTTGVLTFATLSDVIDWTDGTQGAILFRGATEWEALAPGNAGEVLNTNGAGADPSWEEPPAGSAAWQLAGAGQTATGIWDQAVDGTKATVDFTGLAGFNEWFLMVEGVSKSVSGGMEVRLSVDNGTNYLAVNGDYQSISAAGVAANYTSLGGIHNTATTAARDGMMHILFTSHSGSIRGHSLLTNTHVKLMNASLPNAIRLFPTAGGNFTAGKVKLYAR